MTDTLDRNPDLALLENDLNQISQRERAYSGWMAQIITNLPHDPAYKKLNPRLREEIETVITAVE